MTSPPDTRICGSCGAPAASWARFCRECGSDLPAASEQVAQEPAVSTAVVEELSYEPTVPWRAWEGIVVWLAALVATIIPAGIIAVGLDCNLADLTTAESRECDQRNIATIIGNEVALFVFTIAWVKLRHKKKASSLGLRWPTGRAAVVGGGTAAFGLLVAYGLPAILGVLYQLLTNEVLEPPKQVDLQSAPSTAMLALLGFAVVVLAPIAEETFFRGFLFRGVRRWATPPLAMGITAVIFGAVHFIPIVIVSTGLLGLLLARTVEREGNITAAIIAHMLFNATGFALLVGTQSY